MKGNTVIISIVATILLGFFLISTLNPLSVVIGLLLAAGTTLFVLVLLGMRSFGKLEKSDNKFFRYLLLGVIIYVVVSISVDIIGDTFGTNRIFLFLLMYVIAIFLVESYRKIKRRKK